MRTEKELEGVSLLGNQHVVYSDQYNPSVLAGKAMIENGQISPFRFYGERDPMPCLQDH